MREIFKDANHNRQFSSEGYVHLEALSATVIQRIATFYRETSPQEFSGFRHSLELRSPKVKQSIHEFLRELFESNLAVYFNDYQPIASTFVSKQPDSTGTVHPHQDWTFVDESKYASINLWIPLCDTNSVNGRLGFIKGSHRLNQNVRGSNIPPRIVSKRPLEQYAVFEDMKAGEVMIYDHRLIHCSGNNGSDRERTAASISIIPKESTPLHFVGDKSRRSKLLQVQVDERFYWNYFLDSLVYRDPASNHNVDIEGYASREVDYSMPAIDVDAIGGNSRSGGFKALMGLGGRLKARWT